jgi:branched-chain amino acid transport system ATP-binding protein
MGHLLDVSQVNKSFGGLVAVNDMSMFVEQGDMLGLVGPNGSGKTTLFNLITGIYKPDSGSISFDGDRISGLKPHKVSGLGIARTFQIVRPFPRMSVVENVMAAALFGNRSSSMHGARERALELLDYTSLSEKSQARAGSLTLAEQRRLELARALATNPKLLMLDEVMAGLSHTEIAGVVQLLQKIRQDQGTTMIITEHVMRAIVQLCNRMVVMNQGQRLAEGTPSEVMRESSVIKAYMGEKKAPSHHEGGE